MPTLQFFSNAGTFSWVEQLLLFFVCFDALHPRKQFFSHVKTISYLPGLNQYLEANKVPAQGHNKGTPPQMMCLQ